MTASHTIIKKQIKKLEERAKQDFKAGKYDQSGIVCEKLLRKDPGNGDAHRILALICIRMNRLNEALNQLQAGCRMNPDDSVIHATLGDILIYMGRTQDAAAALHRAVILQPGNKIYKTSFVHSMHDFSFIMPHKGIKDALVLCLQGPCRDVAYQDLMRACRSLLDVDPAYEYLRVLINTESYEAFTRAVDIKSLEASLSDSLFLLLMMRIIIPDPKLEKLYMHLRRYFLENESTREEKYIHFLCAMACQCFYNEYVFSSTLEERGIVENLERSLTGSGDLLYDILLLGCYKALHRVSNIGKLITPLEGMEYPGLAELLQLQITDPMEEMEAMKTISSFGFIRDRVSEAVRKQYDQNPYPRWNSLAIFDLTADQRKHSKGKDILIAGAGTGREAASAANSFPEAKILAVDLSLPSLAYGARQISKLGIDNIELMQADILELGELDMRFDLVAASGVLHFMDEPGKALEVLVGLVKPGGVLKTGIYSKIARRKHVELHRYVSEKGYQLTIEGLHAFRNDVFETGQDSPVTSDLPGHFDFYSTSMCRDLVFHVHEHAYNLIEIKAMLDRADLYLLRMEMSNPANKSSYRQMFPGDPDLRNIENLHQFEMSNQDAFIEMYNLWLCRKDEADSCDYSWVSMIGA